MSILACLVSVSTRVRRESWGMGRELKKRNNGGGQRRKRLPSPFHFFPFRSSVRAIPRLETLATQAMSIYIIVQTHHRKLVYSVSSTRGEVLKIYTRGYLG